MNLLHIKISCC